MSKKHRIKRHMTTIVRDGVNTMIFNYSCMPCGIYRKAFLSDKGRKLSIQEHLAKKKH